MRILFLVPRLHPNMNSLINSILDSNHEVEVLVSFIDVNEDHSKIQPQKIGLLKQKGSPSKVPFANPLKLLHRIMIFKPDLIIYRADRNRFTLSSIFSLIPYRKKIIIYDQYKIANNRKWIEIFIKFRDLLINPKLVITPVFDLTERESSLTHIKYENQKQYIKRITNQFEINNGKRFWMPFGVERISFKSKSPWKNRPIDILISSKLVRQKNIIEVVAQLNELSRIIKMPIKVTLAIIKRNNEYDDLYLKLLNQEILKLNHMIKLNLVFNVPPQNMSEYYIKSKIFILISDNEPASYSNIQAAAAGCYIFLSKSNGTALQHPINSSIINFSGLSGLSKEIKTVLNLEPKDIELIQEFRANFIELFNSEKLVQRLVEMWKNKSNYH